MLKRIPKSDISVRPFKAFKEWTFNESSSEISLLEAVDGDYLLETTSSTTNLSFKKRSLFGQLRAQFYNGHEDNPFLRFGNKTNAYEISSAGRDRFLSGSAKVISIPQIYVGEGIKKGSVRLLDDSTYIDDGNGNLIDSAGDTVTIDSINIEDNVISFTDLINNSYDASFQSGIGSFDIQSGTFNLVYNGVNYNMTIVSFDIETGVMVVENIPFLTGAAGTNKIGNVFYSQGLIVITRAVNEMLLNNWDLSFKSTQTIYEHEYLLIANEDEFNISQNPTAIVEVGKETELITGTDGKIYRTVSNPGVKYIKKQSTLENGNVIDYRFTSSIDPSVSAGFEQYEYSSSIDTTGSFLTPFITTIGLYDDEMDLIAVAKLPQPIKSEPDIPVNFIVRFDT